MIKLNGKEVQFETFPNGETKLVHESILDVVTNADSKFEFKYENDSDLIKLLFAKKYWNKQNLSFHIATLDIAYMPYSRMDRSEEGSPFTLEYVADFINNLNFDKVIVNEAHSDVTLDKLNNCMVYLRTPQILLKAMEELEMTEDDYIMFPDAGAEKRYAPFLQPKNKIVGHKKRDFETGRITGLEIESEYESKSSRVIIIDDLSSYGGTFVKSAIELERDGFDEIYLVVTHAENAIFKGELFKHINKVFTTDSILTEENNWENKKFKDQLKVYKMEELSQ